MTYLSGFIETIHLVSSIVFDELKKVQRGRKQADKQRLTRVETRSDQYLDSCLKKAGER